MSTSLPAPALAKFPQPAQYEPRITELWQQQQCFTTPPEPDSPAQGVYTILMPPPNVTSQLHMGHGTGYTLQDWLVRWQRMRRGVAAWIPGLDHAGIATQMMVEKQLLAEGSSKHELGRSAFIERATAWKSKYGHKILDQFTAMGFSCDFSQLAYTLDEQCSHGVRYAFAKLYTQGLIYRGERLVHWDPSLQTALGDDEVENQQITGALYEMRYPLEDGSGHIVVATTRPETMFGDVAVAVNPHDERYQALIGSRVIIPLSGKVIPIIGDEYVKVDFGTGALKITPAHDDNDYLIGQRHGLPAITIFDDQARLCGEVPQAFAGLERFAARKAIITALKAEGYYHGSQPYTYNAPHSSRSGCLIEPKLCSQWFVRMRAMAEQAATAARTGAITFHPPNWQKTWLYWLDHIRDWCISRQLWWGHRIPVWTCSSCGHEFSSIHDPTACERCHHPDLTQEEDVLDTWFSSWLWPLSPFGWPQDTPELSRHYPSQVLVTGPDIIFQWVARMTMAGLTFKGSLPFKDVLFTPIVCDKQGRKFSKTLGNGIDPMDVIATYGADALRFTAAFIAPQGGRIKMAMNDFKVGQSFVQKIWQASRYVLSVCQDESIEPLADLKHSVWQAGLLDDLARCAKETQQHLKEYNTHEAVRTLYQYSWNALCDWGIEACKSTLKREQGPEQAAGVSVILYAHESALRLLHPLIPFVTEELWQHLPPHPDLPRGRALCVSSYPHQLPRYPELASQWQLIKALSHKIRALKHHFNIPTAIRNQLKVYAKKLPSSTTQLDPAARNLIMDLAQVSHFEIIPAHQPLPPQSLMDCTLGFEWAIPVGEHMAAWSLGGKPVVLMEFLRGELKATQKHLSNVERKLGNPGFLAGADAAIITKTKAYHAELRDKHQALQRSLASF